MMRGVAASSFEWGTPVNRGRETRHDSGGLAGRGESVTGLVATTPMDVVLDTQRVGDEKIDRVALAATRGEISDAVAGKLL